MTTTTRRWWLALAVAVGAVGDLAAQPAPRRFARRGEVCHVGRRSQQTRPGAVARPCAPGLRCCYPCGIAGCDSICLRDCGPPRP